MALVAPFLAIFERGRFMVETRFGKVIAIAGALIE
jgi:hypothetical protein